MFDTEKFIVEIEQRPPLYDVGSKDYSNKNIKARCWSEVCEAMEEDWANLSVDLKDKKAKEFMKKWKAMRDYFVKEYRVQKKCQTGVPASKKKKYLYYDQLSFLIPHVKGNTNTQTNVPAQDAEEAADVDEPAHVQQKSVANENIPDFTQQSPDDAAKRQSRQRTRKRKNDRLDIAKTVASTSKSLTDILSESLNIRKQEITSDKYGHKAFLNSFIPTMDSFPPTVAAYARMKISELFNQIAYEGIPSPPLNVPGLSECSYYSTDSSRSQTPQQECSMNLSRPNSNSNSVNSVNSPESQTQELHLEEVDEFQLSNYILLP